MQKLLLIAVAGGFGALSRYGLEDSQYLAAFGNLGLQNGLGLAAVILGLTLGKLI
jgi:fluoride ion exporter CrcB/FEX